MDCRADCLSSLWGNVKQEERGGRNSNRWVGSPPVKEIPLIRLSRQLNVRAEVHVPCVPPRSDFGDIHSARFSCGGYKEFPPKIFDLGGHEE